MLDKLFRNTSSNTSQTGTKPDDIQNAPDRASDLMLPHADNSAPDSASASVTVRLSGHEIAIDNEIEILKALHKFGWLTSRQIAQWGWPNGAQRVQMARRTLNRLKEAGQLLTGNLPNGVPVYALSASGAARLYDHGIRARSGKDIGFRRWQHRAICNWHAILLHSHGYEIDTEYELYAGRARIPQWYGKIADVIGYSDDRFRWVEVEHSRRKPSDLRKMLHLLTHAPMNPRYAHNMSLECIEFVTTDIRLTNALARALEKALADDVIPNEHKRTIWASIVVTELKISPGLILTDHVRWAMPLKRFCSGEQR